MRKSEKGSFLLATKRLMHEMDQILNSSGVQWECREPFDVRLYITAMQRLCEEQHFDGHRVAHLRQVARAMEAMRGPVDPDELKAGEEHALQFEQWDGRSVQPC